MKLWILIGILSVILMALIGLGVIRAGNRRLKIAPMALILSILPAILCDLQEHAAIMARYCEVGNSAEKAEALANILMVAAPLVIIATLYGVGQFTAWLRKGQDYQKKNPRV